MNPAASDVESMIDAALAFAARGWRPFPVDHPSLPVCAGTGDRCRRNRERLGDCATDKRGKHPVGGWGTMTASEPNERMLRVWFAGEARNIGIACGPSGLLVLDEDTVDSLAKLAEQLGEVVPVTYRVRTSRGWHYYFEDPDNEFGNSAGALEDWHIDVRGGRGSGGYVLAAGSRHWSGHTYVAEDPYTVPAPLPEWIKEQLRASPARASGDSSGSGRTGGNGQSSGSSSSSGEWDDEPRYGTPEELRTQYERHLSALRGLAVASGAPNGAAFRHALYLAALDGWRLVDCELLDKHSMLRQIKEAVREVWGADPDQDDREIVYDEARTKANESPWVVRTEQSPGASAYELEKAALKRVERMRREVREELSAENREPLRVLDSDAFLDAATPDYLVPKMFYRDGLSVVFGAPGAAKSFWVLDIALCLATGTSWRERSLGRARVHYVMAEGQATNTLRTRGWLKYHGVDRAELRGYLTVVPTPVVLTEAGIADYLAVVERERPDLIVLDTKNLMFAGKESQGDDYGAMLRVLHRVREAAGGCAVVLIDHSGLTDDSRVRGSNAQKGGVETEVKVTDENGIRRVVVTRDKSGAEGAQWLFKLKQVDGVARPVDVDAPAVCVPADESDITTNNPLAERFENWNDPTQPELPTDVATYRGRGAVAIRALARFMRYSAQGHVGFTLVQARKALWKVYRDDDGKPTWSEDTVQRAWDGLIDMNRLSPVSGTSRTGYSLWEHRAGDPE